MKILFIQQRNWGLRVGHFLAKRFAAEGATLAAVTYKKSAHQFHATQSEVHYEMLVSNDAVFENPELYLDGQRPATLAEICTELGIESVWPLVAGARQITHSYGERYYFAGRQQLSDDEIVRYLQGTYAYIKKIFDEFKPDVVLTPLLIEPSHRMIYHLGKKRGVSCLFLTDSKVRGMTIVAQNPTESEGPFFERVDALNADAETENREKAKKYIADFRASFKSPEYMEKHRQATPLWKLLRHQFAPFRRIVEWYMRDYRERVSPLHPGLDARPPHIILRDHFVHAYRSWTTEHFPYAPFEPTQKYAYYPFQVQPEITIDVFSPYFNNQIELARQIAMSLPDDYTLVVRDHPAMKGFRSPEFLKDIAGTPNVRLIDSRVPSEKVLQNASLVLAPNSTSLVEAAFYGIPAIQFGDQGTPQKMPNVVRHTDLTTLTRAVAERIGQKLGGPEYERRLENYVAAAYDTGYQLNYISMWEEDNRTQAELLYRVYRENIDRVTS